MSTLGGRTALVTGGSRGIGAAIVRHLAAAGARVAFTYRTSADQADAVLGEIEERGGKGLAIEADSADAEAVAAAVDRAAAEFGQLDVLVNNAGVFPFGPIEEVTLEEVDRTLAIHTRAVFVASQAAAKHMGAGGRIISIGSCFSDRVPYAGATLYAMSKSALVGFTRGLARDLGDRGINVMLVNPGSVDTDMNPADGPGADAERELMAVGRYADPDEIATFVTHLAGEGGSFITGAAIPVDGGFAA
jgi:3-oxoacyl-[acyl-carrier protein] reductase